MKWSTIAASLSGTLLASTAVAGPVSVERRQRGGLSVYEMLVETEASSALNGQKLALANGTVGIFFSSSTTPTPLADPDNKLQVYPAPGAVEGFHELHTWPVGVADHQLVLVGDNPSGAGLWSLADVVNPDEATFPDGAEADWSRFVLDVDPEDGPPRVGYGAVAGGWVAVPLRRAAAGGAAGWEVKFYDGTVPITSDYIPIEIFAILSAQSI